MFSRVCRASGGVGWVGGVGGVIAFVGTFTHIPYYMFSTARRTLLCRFEPDQKRMSSDTFGSRLSTCYCHKGSACWPTVFKSRATSGKSTARTHARCCCCCCCCYIDMSAKITLVATTWHSDFVHHWLPMRIPSWLSWFKNKHKNGCSTTTTENLRNDRKIGSQLGAWRLLKKGAFF